MKLDSATTTLLLLLLPILSNSFSLLPSSASSSATTRCYHNNNDLLPNKNPPRTTQLSMVSNFLGGNKNDQKTKELPKDVKEAVSSCRKSVQTALSERTSRMDVEFPVGTKFGIERKSKSESKKRRGGNKLSSALDDDDDGKGMPTKETFDTSDRELARLFVEMFQPVGGEGISVVFRDYDLAEDCVEAWRDDPTANCRITSVNRQNVRDRKKAKKKLTGGGMGMGGKKQMGGKKKQKGFASKLAREFDDAQSGPFALPENTEVALFVSPGPKELIAVERICEEAGMGTLVVLLNARLKTMARASSSSSTNVNVDYFEKEFESIFYLSIAPTGQDEAPNCLLYRSYPDGWILARKPKVGPPKTIGTFDEYPSAEECREAYEAMDVGDFEKGVENVLDNVANWFG